MKICKFCGGEFKEETNKNGIEKKYCSKKCRTDMNSLNSLVNRHKKKG